MSVLLVFALALPACRPNLTAVSADLRCGMSVTEASNVARRHGLDDCGAPTEKVGTPDYGCSHGARGVAFWFDDRGLVAYQLYDGDASDCQDPMQESGCATEVIPMCGSQTAVLQTPPSDILDQRR